MSNDPASLSNLRDIVVPDPPALWPLAPGAWLALSIAIAVLCLLAWRTYSAYKRDAYRRAGLQLLSATDTVHDVSVVLKRVALAAFPREQVASLYGAHWAEFLQTTCPRQDFEQLVAGDASASSDAALIAMANVWIRHHKAPEIRGDVKVS